VNLELSIRFESISDI